MRHKMSADERVAMYSELIAAERRHIKEAHEDIARYAYELQKAANEAALAKEGK